MKLNRRSVIGAAFAAAVPSAIGLQAAEEKQAAVKGKLTEQSLATMLKAMDLDAKVQEKRFDFAFKATIEDIEWELSMSAVLSQDSSSIWVLAWLDELPKSSADVPRTALLRLLSDNDKFGRGKFFAFIASNRRFVLQRVVPNENITAEKFRAILDDLGESVVLTHPHWSVSNWISPATEEPTTTIKSGSSSGAPVKGSGPAAKNDANQPSASTKTTKSTAGDIKPASNQTQKR
jgi:hypothetical protein